MKITVQAIKKAILLFNKKHLGEIISIVFDVKFRVYSNGYICAYRSLV